MFFTRFKKLLSCLFRPKSKGGTDNKVSLYDISVCILPLGALWVLLDILYLIAVALSPLFGANAAECWTNYALQKAAAFGISYLLAVISVLLLLFLERKHVPKMKFGTKLAAVLLWPFFIGLNIVLDVVSLFVRNLDWKEIPHTGTANGTEQNPSGKE